MTTQIKASFLLVTALLGFAAPAFANVTFAPWRPSMSSKAPTNNHMQHHSLIERQAALSSAALRSLRQPGLTGAGVMVVAIFMEESLKTSKCEADANALQSKCEADPNASKSKCEADAKAMKSKCRAGAPDAAPKEGTEQCKLAN